MLFEWAHRLLSLLASCASPVFPPGAGGVRHAVHTPEAQPGAGRVGRPDLHFRCPLRWEGDSNGPPARTRHRLWGWRWCTQWPRRSIRRPSALRDCRL